MPFTPNYAEYIYLKGRRVLIVDDNETNRYILRETIRAFGCRPAEVSSGADAAPEYTYVAAELVRAGHAWVGVSAQYIGVEGGSGSVEVDAGPSGLAAKDPDRYAKMSHPGDAYCYDMFAAIASGLPGGPLADLAVARTLAVGESQSAMALTTYVNSFAAAHNVFDGFLIHSRAVAGLPFGAVGAPADTNRAFSGGPMAIPDVGAPVFIVQTETDLLTNFRFFLARQRDSECPVSYTHLTLPTIYSV